MIKLFNRLQDLLDLTHKVDFVAPLLLRLYLIPIFWMAGTQKPGHFQDTVEWFGNPDWGLGLPFPLLMASMAVVLVLSLPVSLPYWWTIQNMVFAVVLFSLLVQETTTGPLIRRYR